MAKRDTCRTCGRSFVRIGMHYNSFPDHEKPMPNERPSSIPQAPYTTAAGVKVTPPYTTAAAAYEATVKAEQAEPMLQFFSTITYEPPVLIEITKAFNALARKVVAEMPRNPERTVVLRKLLESRDSAIRTAEYK